MNNAQNKPIKRRSVSGKPNQQSQSAEERVSAIRARKRAAAEQARAEQQRASVETARASSVASNSTNPAAQQTRARVADPQARRTSAQTGTTRPRPANQQTARTAGQTGAQGQRASVSQRRAAPTESQPKATYRTTARTSAGSVNRRTAVARRQPAHSTVQTASFGLNPKTIAMAVAALVVLICLIVFVPKILGNIFHPSYPIEYEYVSTKLTGVDDSVSLSYKDSYSTKVTVNPSMGRTLELQRYDSSTKEWNTVKSYDLKDGLSKTTVKVKYPKAWKNYASSTWRIYVPEYSETSEPQAKEDGSKYVTETITEAVKKKVKISNKFVYSKSAVVLEADTGRVVYDYNADKRRRPASMTKIMTAILLCENKAEDDPIKVTKEVRQTEYSFGLAKGDKIKAHDIMYMMMLPSANDAAAAAGLSMASSIPAFGEMMTERAKELGCNNTNFENPHGLDSDKHYSTAHDIAIIGAYAMTSPDTQLIRDAAVTETYDFTSLKKHTYSLITTNGLLGIDGVKGLKTGSTDGAGSCFCGAYYVGEKLYITVVMGDVVGDGSRWTDTKSLMAFARYAAKKGL